MGIPQVTVGAVELDNRAGDNWRKIVGGFSDDLSPGGSRVISVPFQVEGDTIDQLQSRLATTRAAFITRDLPVNVTQDDDAASFYTTISVGDGYHNAIETTVVHGPLSDTSLSVSMMLVITAARTLPPNNGFTGLTAPGLESLSAAETINAGRVSSISVTGSFVTFGGATALQNYNSARAELITDLCQCLSSGAIDTNTNFVLVNERVLNPQGENRRIDFELQSEFQAHPFTNTPAARAVQLGIITTTPDEWDERGGPVPTLIHVQGSVFINKSVFASGVYFAWDTVRQDIEDFISQETGESDLSLVKRTIGIDPDQRLLNVDVVYQSGQPINLEYTRIDRIQIAVIEAVAPDSFGFETIQEAPHSPEVIRFVSITRKGLGQLSIRDLIPTPPSPVMFDRQVLLRSVQPEEQGPLTTDFGENTWNQSVVLKYREAKLREAIPDTISTLLLG